MCSSITWPSSGLVATYNATLKVNSNVPDNPTKTVNLSALWQAYSEKSPTGTYGEPTLAQIVSLFGYQTTIVGAGQKMNTMGRPTAVGDEVISKYWKLVDPNIGVKVRMIAAFHRQNNFDPITGEQLTAASSVRWYYKTSSVPSTTTNIFTHNTDEGQAFLPHITKS